MDTIPIKKHVMDLGIAVDNNDIATVSFLLKIEPCWKVLWTCLDNISFSEIDYQHIKDGTIMHEKEDLGNTTYLTACALEIIDHQRIEDTTHESHLLYKKLIDEYTERGNYMNDIMKAAYEENPYNLRVERESAKFIADALVYANIDDSEVPLMFNGWC